MTNLGEFEMRNFDDWGRRLIIGVLFFAATAALGVSKDKPAL
jgi:hypothetical protein